MFIIKIIEELKEYCEQEKPIGALLLTGEWGCGKTHLIKNELNNELKDSHILIIVSLFGMNSVEDIKTDIKRKWLFAHLGSKQQEKIDLDKLGKCTASVKTIFEKLTNYLPGPVKPIMNGVFSLNFLDFVNVESMIGNKRVVLIFDDFERSNVSLNNLLGCINDYNENQNISTIIVANEEKINSNDNHIEYQVIKEKIIRRTVSYKPDSVSIVNSIINEIPDSDNDYKDFLKKNVGNIRKIFSGMIEDERAFNILKEKGDRKNLKENDSLENINNKRTLNIRSLKYAIHDFSRIFCLIKEIDIREKEKCLYSYITVVLSARAGLINQRDLYGTIIANSIIHRVYPGYYFSNYITSSIMEWIFSGEWDKNRILSELSDIKEREKATKPEDKVRTNWVLYLDESDVIDGYPKLLERAYDGRLELNDYVYILYNRYLAKNNSIILPEIDWNKIQKGVQAKINSLLSSYKEPDYKYKKLDSTVQDNFSKEEKLVYEMIESFWYSDLQILENNKKKYIEEIEKDPIVAFCDIKNMRLNIFDDEVIGVSLTAFKKISNADKAFFVGYFIRFWKFNLDYGEFDNKQFIDATEIIKKELENFMKDCEIQKLYIVCFHTNVFIEKINELIIEYGDKYITEN